MEQENDSGKILRSTFEKTIWKQTGAQRGEVLAGPRYGVDVSVVRLTGGLLMASASDPASLIPALGLAESAWLTVHLTANDLATTGQRPMYAQFVLNLPLSVTDGEFREYWGCIHRYCDQIGVAITGGHTGKVYGQESTFAGGVTMSLIAEDVLLSSGMLPGQSLLVTKGSAIAACAILAKSFPSTVSRRLGAPVWKALCDSFWNTSVLQEALVGYETGKVSAMHDVTEGGIVGAIAEMCGAAGCGAVIREENLPVSEVTREMAALFGFDPIRSLGSGALLMACDKKDEKLVIGRLAEKGIPAWNIGYTADISQGITLCNEITGSREPVAANNRDPYWKAYFNATGKGWK